MRTKTLKVRIEAPFDFKAAAAALEKVQSGIAELVALLRKNVRKKASSRRLKDHVLGKRLKEAV
jgi:hypothetical protein